MGNRNGFAWQTNRMLSLHKPKRIKLRAVHGEFSWPFRIFSSSNLFALHFVPSCLKHLSCSARVLVALAKIHILLCSLRATNRIHKNKSKSRHNYHQISLLLRAAFELNHLLASRFVYLSPSFFWHF